MEQQTNDIAGQATARYWRTRIEKQKKAHRKFHKQAEEAEKAARDEECDNNFNLHWSTCKIVRSAIYANRPKPDVRRRFQKPDPEEKELARMVERAIEYQVDTLDFDAQSQLTVKDYVQVGLGVPRVYYDVQTEQIENPIALALAEAMGQPVEQVVAQSVGIDHIPWRYFHWEPGKKWSGVNWIAFETWRPVKEVNEEYGVSIKGGSDDENHKRDAQEYANEVQLFEIWHRPTAKVYIIAANHDVPLDEYDDPLGLTGFFPVPRPLFANIKSEELLPKPDYQFIAKQMDSLNGLTKRIDSLSKQIRANGYYDADMTGLDGLLNAPDGTLKPVAGLAAQTEGKPDSAIVFLPLMEKIQTVRELQSQKEEIKGQIYETIGISDIVRGSTHASETAAAQNLKGQWANVRLSEKTGEVARVWREVFRMMAEIICEHFNTRILSLQTGVEITPRMVEIMKSDIGRSFAIDIETDSTIAKDDYEDRQQTMELVDTILAKMEQALPGVQSGLLTPEFVTQTLLFVVSKHKHGKQLEDAIHEMQPHLEGLQQFQQQMSQMQQALAERDQQLQQAGEHIQGLEKQLGAFNERKEAREDAKVQHEIEDGRFDSQVDASEAQAGNQLKQAQAAKVYHDMAQPTVVRFGA